MSAPLVHTPPDQPMVQCLGLSWFESDEIKRLLLKIHRSSEIHDTRVRQPSSLLAKPLINVIRQFQGFWIADRAYSFQFLFTKLGSQSRIISSIHLFPPCRHGPKLRNDNEIFIFNVCTHARRDTHPGPVPPPSVYVDGPCQLPTLTWLVRFFCPHNKRLLALSTVG